MATADSSQRSKKYRKPLNDTTEWVNNQLSPPSASSERHSTPHLPHHASLKPGGNLRLPNPSSPGSYPTDKRLSAVSGSDRNTNRDSYASATSTDASKKSRRKTHVGPWQLGKTLGKGASGRVRVAKHAVTGQKAAVKIVSKKAAELLRTHSLAVMDTLAAQNGQSLIPFGIEREVVIMKLIEHPHVISLYDVWENRGELYLVLEYVEGGELFHYIRRNGGLPEEEAVRIFRQMIAGLSYCHRFNICHRDLKPENILLDRYGNIKIVDFGMAALQPHNKWLTTSCGSPHYASPEVIQGKEYRGDRADIWSAGIILYAMLAGTLPFDSGYDDYKEVIQQVLKGEYTFPENMSELAQDLISRMLEYDPRLRIPMKKMWEHPLLKRSEALDAKDADGKAYIGPPASLTTYDCGPPIRNRKDLDGELLRNLQNLWHGVPAEEVIKKLLSDAPNHERVLYTKLLKFREEHLENYEGSAMEYSVSDYRHVKEPLKRSSTRASLQPPLPSKCHSQYSIMSDNVAKRSQSHRIQRMPSLPETEQSYDPFRASSKQQMAKAEADQARITVLRGSSTASRQRPASIYSRRWASRTSLRNPALDRIQDDVVYSLPISSSSSGSPQQRRISRAISRRSMISNSSAMRKSVSYKRNVSFVHSQRRTASANHPILKAKRESNAWTLQERYKQENQDGDREQSGKLATPRQSVNEASDTAASPQPEVPQVVRSRKTVKTPSGKATAPNAGPTRASQFWRDDTRKVSTELEKFCDEAFNRSSLQLSGTPLADSEDQMYETPATTLSREVSAASVIQHHQRASRPSGQLDPKELRERPLPRIPSPEHPGSFDLNRREIAKARELLLQRAADPSMAGSLDEVITHLDRLMQPSAIRLQDQERRAASTPGPKSPLERSNDTFERFLQKGYTGIRSTSEPVNVDHPKLTVRMVETNGQTPISPTKPLTIRKKSGSSTPSTDSGRLRSMTSQDWVSYQEDSRPHSRTHSGEYRSAGLHHLDHALEPIEEDDDKENFDPRDRKQKTLSGESKKRSWFRRHQQGQGSQGGERSRGPLQRDEVPSQDCQFLTPSVELKRAQDPESAEAQNKPKSSGKGRFFKIFGKRDDKQAKNVSAGVPGEYGLDDGESIDTITSSRLHHSAYMSGALKNPSTTSVEHGRRTTDDTGANVPPPRVIQPQPQNWLARFLRIKPAVLVMCFQISKVRARKEVASTFREWRKYGLRDIVIDKAASRIWARVAEKNSLHIRPVSFAVELFTVLEHGRKANLSVARFTQEKGAKSSFERVMEALEKVLGNHGLIVEDRQKIAGMRSVLETQ